MRYDDDFHRTIVENLSDGVYYVDRLRRITYWNRGAERLTGYAAREVIGRRCQDGILMHCDDDGRPLCGQGCPLAGTMRDGEPRQVRVWLHHKDGHRHPVCVRSAPIRDDAGRIVGAVEVFHDDSEVAAIRARLAELERLALLDPLTGTANRRGLESALARRLADWFRYGRRFGVLFADIDGFKAINDRFGHDVGDDVIEMVGRTLAFGARAGDLAGRWGGEEFLVLVEEVDVEGLAAIAERLRALVSRSSIERDGQRVAVTISVGATLVEPNDTAQTLLRHADELLYRSKSDGRDRVTLGVRRASSGPGCAEAGRGHGSRRAAGRTASLS